MTPRRPSTKARLAMKAEHGSREAWRAMKDASPVQRKGFCPPSLAMRVRDHGLAFKGAAGCFAASRHTLTVRESDRRHIVADTDVDLRPSKRHWSRVRTWQKRRDAAESMFLLLALSAMAETMLRVETRIAEGDADGEEAN